MGSVLADTDVDTGAECTSSRFATDKTLAFKLVGVFLQVLVVFRSRTLPWLLRLPYGCPMPVSMAERLALSFALSFGLTRALTDSTDLHVGWASRVPRLLRAHVTLDGKDRFLLVSANFLASQPKM